jgi:hypothetical protein
MTSWPMTNPNHFLPFPYALRMREHVNERILQAYARDTGVKWNRIGRLFFFNTQEDRLLFIMRFASEDNQYETW